MRIIPSYQRLGADDAATLQIHFRLVVQQKFVAHHRAPKVFLDQVTPLIAGAQFGGKKLIAVAAAVLRVVHRGIGTTQQRRTIFAVVRINRDADRHAEKILVFLQQKWFRHGLEDPVRQQCHVRGFIEALRQNHEFVTAQASQRVGVAGTGGKALGDGLQQLVAALVADGIVDALEAVEVKEQDRDPLIGAARQLERMGQSLGQEGAVRQSGQRIVCRHMLQPLLRILDDGDIGKRDQHGAGLGFARILNWQHVFRQPHHDAVHHLDTDHQIEHRLSGAQHAFRRQIEADQRDAAFIDHALEIGPAPPSHQRVGRHSQDPFRTRVAGQDLAIAALHHDPFSQAAHYRAVAVLAHPQRDLGRLAVGDIAGDDLDRRFA